MINFVLWILFGALVGWVASIIMGTNAKQGALANIVVGILGALLGGLVANLLGISAGTSWSWQGFLVSLGGAVLLLAIVRAFNRAR